LDLAVAVVVAAGIMEYSRHKEGEPDARGTRSMMEIHADAQRQAMQEAGLGALRRLVPKASAPTCLSALEATGWDADEAYKHLRAFLEVEEKAQKDAAADAKREEKKRKREALKKSRRETSASESGSSDSDSDSESSSSSSSRRRAKRKKHKKHKKHKRKAKHKRGKDKNASSDDEDDRGRPSRAEKRRKRAKREKKELPAAFGARGVIRETDKNEKEPEFRAWLEEVKRVNLESVTKHEEREYFKEYAEDYNTNTLPGEKFYNLDRWAVAEAARRAAADAAGETRAEERLTFDDEAERKAELARERAERTAEYKRSAYERMKDTGDLQNLREQERLKEQRKQAYNVGDVETVEKINKILAPDEPGRR
jgi:hypothetical protein